MPSRTRTSAKSEDRGGVVAMLVSQARRRINGAIFDVNGGSLMRA
ncbi:hypothetical protein ACQKO5_21580 [Novosphingobium subterraneum]